MLHIAHIGDSHLESLLGNAHSRFQSMIAEAEVKARPFYKQCLDMDIGIQECIEHIFTDVDQRGDEAVCHYSRAFDNSPLGIKQLIINSDEMAAAWESIDDELRQALKTSCDQVRDYQEKLLLKGFGEDLSSPLGVRWVPLRRVGAYVPGGVGGTLPLCSTVIMNVVPAVVAGVEECVVCTPPRADGSVAPELLAACHAAGVTAVYKAGGIQAIAAMACGTISCPQVDKIVGPGNIFVTLAKRHAYGRVDIDMLAGPSEVVVISDGSCDPQWVAADVLSQAEHDPLAMCMLLSINENNNDIEKVNAAISEQLAALPEERRIVASQSIQNLGTAVRCDTIEQAAEIVNRYAPEHLELLTQEPKKALSLIRNAGAIFVGPWSPEPIGDYIAGPSHTLPTGGSARMWSGIGADTFLRRSSIINFSQEDFMKCVQPALKLANSEGLAAHARSLSIRLEGSADS
ncbi:MAG: histidinol dehydrogenase [Planctomycetes bacterium]|nr:histidinol dehydrogenase [Planctomycetota bacterium]